MPPAKYTHRVFVDFENVSNIDLTLIAGRSVHVALLIGKSQTKLDLGLVQQIHKLASQVELIEVGAAGRNALDMTLACYLGRTIQQHPADHYHIISADKDYDPLIAHLRAGDTAIARHNSFATLPFLPKSDAKSTTPARRAAPAPVAGKVRIDRRPKLIARLSNSGSRNRPSTRQALLAHIKTALGKESTDDAASDIIRHLCDTRVLSIDEKGRVQYPG